MGVNFRSEARRVSTNFTERYFSGGEVGVRGLRDKKVSISLAMGDSDTSLKF